MKTQSGKRKILHIQSGNYVVSHIKMMRELLKAFEEQCGEQSDFVMDTLLPVVTPAEARKAPHKLKVLEYGIMRPLQLLFTRRNYDLYHVHCWTCNTVLPVLPKVSQRVITVHDLCYLMTPEAYPPKALRTSRFLLNKMRQGDQVVAVSGFTADALVKYANFPREDITVIPNGVDYKLLSTPQPLPAGLDHLHGHPYILVIGSNDSRKNLQLLGPALEPVLNENPKVQVLRVGPRFEENIEKGLTENVGLNRLHYAANLDDKELAAVFSHAACLFFPSVFEGYGMPVVEALAAGTPVACSNITPHLEVSGGHALFFDPANSEEAARQVRQCLRLTHSVRENVKKGRAFAQGLDWSICAQQYLSLYQKLLSR